MTSKNLVQMFMLLVETDIEKSLNNSCYSIIK